MITAQKREGAYLGAPRHRSSSWWSHTKILVAKEECLATKVGLSKSRVVGLSQSCAGLKLSQSRTGLSILNGGLPPMSPSGSPGKPVADMRTGLSFTLAHWETALNICYLPNSTLSTKTAA